MPCINRGAETVKETKEEKNDGRRRVRAEGEVDRSFCPSRCQRQIIVLTLSELLPGRAPRPSPDYSLIDGEIAAASSFPRLRLCPPRETRTSNPTFDHLKLGREEGGGGGGAAEARAFEVWSTRLTGVDQISEGEIIQGHRRRDRDKAPVAAYHL